MRGLAALVSQLSARPRLYLQTTRGVQQPTGRRGRRYWVVSRSQCRFFKVPVSPEAPVSNQLDALALQISRLSPFAETGSHYHFGSDFVALWLWDQAAVRNAGEAIGTDVLRLRVVPESALLPSAEEGVRLVRALEGFEGQSWSKDGLVASRWWPALPDARAWTLFQRGASVLPDRISSENPAATRLDWLDRPWTQARRTGSFTLGQVDMLLAATGVGAMMLILFGYLGAEWLRVSGDLAATETAIAARASGTEPGMRARAEALENQAADRALIELDRFPTQLALMARVSEILPKNETHLTEWSYENGRLEMTVAADHPLDAVYFVSGLEKIDRFKGVAAERAGSDNSLHIRLTIDPK